MKHDNHVYYEVQLNCKEQNLEEYILLAYSEMAIHETDLLFDKLKLK